MEREEGRGGVTGRRGNGRERKGREGRIAQRREEERDCSLCRGIIIQCIRFRPGHLPWGSSPSSPFWNRQ